MSDSSVSAPAQSFAASAQNYALSDDLARLCLPQEFKDSNRTLAWANSICFLFLVIGCVGLKAPRVIQRPLSELPETIPTVWTPPEEQPKPQVEIKQEEEQPQETPVDTPQVATVVAVVDSPNVAFSVPVEGAVQVAPSARYATAPPPVTQAPPPKPRTFIPGQGEGGTFPWPRAYPREALDQRAQGTVMLYVVVDTNGAPAKVEIKDSSGHYSLDRAALDWLKTHWKWLPGETRYYYVPFEYKLQ